MTDVYLMYYEVPSKKDIIGQAETFSAPYWKQMVSGNFKDDNAAIAYYNTDFKPHYAPIPTRLTTMDPVTQRNGRTVKIDGKTDPLNKEGQTTDNNNMIMIAIAIIIVIVIIFIAMKHKG